MPTVHARSVREPSLGPHARRLSIAVEDATCYEFRRRCLETFISKSKPALRFPLMQAPSHAKMRRKGLRLIWAKSSAKFGGG
jgi:hypothetical protein